MRGPLCVLVVLFHSGMTLPDDIIQVSFSRVLFEVVVPYFFFFSGFLFFIHCKGQFGVTEYIGKLKKRFHSLLIPYVLWISIYLLLRSLVLFWSHESFVDYWNLGGVGDFFKFYWNYKSLILPYDDWSGCSGYSTVPLLVPLWFLRDLFVVSLLAPIIFFLIKRFNTILVWLLGIAYLAQVWPIHTGATISALFWFVFGAYFSIKGKDFIDVLSRYRVPSYFTSCALFIAEVYYHGVLTPVGYYLHTFFALSMFVSIIGLYSRFPAAFVKNEMLVKASFFIYVFHGFLVPYVQNLMVRIFPSFPSQSYVVAQIQYVMVPLLVIMICILTYLFMAKYTNQLLLVLTGNR